MLILVDEDVSGAVDLFGPLGDVQTFAGRTVQRAQVADAEALVVRSVTRVDAALLAGSRVRFVGTVTSGTDHLDTEWLASEGIEHASAAGCNAQTVAEYVIAVILTLAERQGFDPVDWVMGVVGVGRIGGLVADWGEALGLSVLRCDPPRVRRAGGAGFVGFDELARRSGIVTLHTSLTRHGADATCEMVDEAWLSQLKRGAILINTSRGEVIREADLAAAIVSGRLGATVLDVWRNEPNIDKVLAGRVDIATPHVAGYSIEARRRGSLMIRDSLAAFAGMPIARGIGGPAAEAGRRVEGQMPGGVERAPAQALTRGEAAGRDESSGGDWRREVGRVVCEACDVGSMAQAFRRAMAHPGNEGYFDDARRALAARREFGERAIAVGRLGRVARTFLSQVGFRFGV